VEIVILKSLPLMGQIILAALLPTSA